MVLWLLTCVSKNVIPQTEVLFDIHVVDTDAQSYRNHTPMAVLSSVEHNIKQ